MISIGDVKFSYQLFFKTPGTTLLSLLVLSLGVGISLSMFTLVNGILWSSVDSATRDRLVSLQWVRNDIMNNRNIRAVDLEAFRQRNKSFENIAGYAFHYERSLSVPNSETYTDNYQGIRTTFNFFDVIGANALLGRTFIKEDVAGENNNRMVISYRVWQELYAGDQEVIGKEIVLSGRRLLIIGVMPEGFLFPFQAEFWIADSFSPPPGKTRKAVWKLRSIGVLKKGVDKKAAETELANIAAQLAKEFPDTNKQLLRVELQSFSEGFLGDSMRKILYGLLFCSILVVFVAAVNVSNMILSRTIKRNGELAIRNALGASRQKIISLVLVDGFLLSIISASLGFLFSLWASKLIWPAFQQTSGTPYWWHMRVDTNIVVFVFGLTIFTALISSLIPALRASRIGVLDMLKDGTRSVSGTYVGRVSATLVGIQIALSSVLLMVCAAMMNIQNQYISRPFPQDTSEVLSTFIPMNRAAGFTDDAQVWQFMKNVEQELVALPGIHSVAYSVDDGVTDRGLLQEFAFVGEEYGNDSYPNVYFSAVTPSFNQIFGLTPLRGRFFNDNDKKDSEPVCVVNKHFVDAYMNGKDPIDKSIQIQESEFGGAYYAFRDRPIYRIIGVVDDTRQAPLPHEDIKDHAQIFVPYEQRSFRFVYMLVRGEGNPSQWAKPLRKALHKYAPLVAPTDIIPLDQRIKEEYALLNLLIILFATMGAVSLFKAFAGLYAVMTYYSQSQRRDNAIRLALGAKPINLIVNIMKKSWVQVIGGLAIGLSAGHFVINVLKNAIEESNIALGLHPYIFAIILVVVAAFVAMILPAWQSSKISPSKALHES